MGGQLKLFKCETEYGGDFRTGKAKTRRPLSTRKPLHVTLRSSRAVGAMSLRRHREAILRILERQALRWGVRVYKRAVNGNHIHLVLRGESRLGIQNFFRTVAGLIARLVTRAERGRAFGKFWDRVLWSRVGDWGRAYRILKNYVLKNELEAQGIIPYERASTRFRPIAT